MPQTYKLFYFDERARAEPIRLVFVYADVPFEDIRMSPDEFAKNKNSFPNGQIPVLEINGEVLSQSGAIIRYIARKFGLCGKDELEAARCDELYNVYDDRFNEQIPYFFYKFGNPDYKDGDKIFNETYLPSAKKACDYYKKIITNPNKSSFVLVSGISYADFCIAEHLETMFEWAPKLKDEYPKLLEYKNKIYGLPQIEEYINKRKHTIC